MGWLPVQNDLATSDCIGDIPLDILEQALDRIAAERVQRGMGRPDLQEYLDTFAAILQAHGSRLYEEGKRLSVKRVVARLSTDGGGLSREITGDPFHPSDEGLFAECVHAFEGIAGAYWTNLTRAPRLRELLATIEVALSSEPSSGPSAFRLEKVVAETRQVSTAERFWLVLCVLYAKSRLSRWW